MRGRNLKLEKVYRSCRRNRGGAAVVEFAIVAPIFFLFVFGIIEYGRMVMVQQVITNASREGARVAVLDGSTNAGNENDPFDVSGKVKKYLTGANLPYSPSFVNVDPNPPSSANYNDPVTVKVSIPFNQVSWLPSPLYLGGTTLTATSTMRREAVQ